MKRLNEPVAPLANFIASGARCGSAPSWGRSCGSSAQLPLRPGKLDAFFPLLPRDTEAAAAWAGATTIA